MVGVKHKGISFGFVVAMLMVVIGIAGFFYTFEIRFIERSVSIEGEVISVRSVPRKHILKIRTDEVLFLDVPLSVAVPFWDKKKRGDRVRLRVDPNFVSHVKVDETIYLHRTSVSILSGFVIILVIACGTILLRKRSKP